MPSEHVLDAISGILVEDILLAPKMDLELFSGYSHKSRIDALYKYIHQNAGQLPYGEGIILSYINGRVQVHNGNHRLVALAMYNHNATIGSIRQHITSIHHEQVSEGKIYYFHIFTNFQPGVDFEEIETSDGAVKCITTRVPISVLDQEIFKEDSLGMPIWKVARNLACPRIVQPTSTSLYRYKTATPTITKPATTLDRKSKPAKETKKRDASCCVM